MILVNGLPREAPSFHANQLRWMNNNSYFFSKTSHCPSVLDSSRAAVNPDQTAPWPSSDGDWQHCCARSFSMLSAIDVLQTISTFLHIVHDVNQQISVWDQWDCYFAKIGNNWNVLPRGVTKGCQCYGNVICWLIYNCPKFVFIYFSTIYKY